MPWVLAEYLAADVTPHDHEFCVRWFDGPADLQTWTRGFDRREGIMVKVMELHGGTRLTRPVSDWVRMRPPGQLMYFHDGITQPVGFAFQGQSLVHNHPNTITVARWRIHSDGSVNHECRQGYYSNGLGRYYLTRWTCSNCRASASNAWLRTRATNIVNSTSGRR